MQSLLYTFHGASSDASPSAARTVAATQGGGAAPGGGEELEDMEATLVPWEARASTQAHKAARAA